MNGSPKTFSSLLNDAFDVTFHRIIFHERLSTRRVVSRARFSAGSFFHRLVALTFASPSLVCFSELVLELVIVEYVVWIGL